MREANVLTSVEMSTRTPSYPDTQASVSILIREESSGEVLAAFSLTADQLITLMHGDQRKVPAWSAVAVPALVPHFGHVMESKVISDAFKTEGYSYQERDAEDAEAQQRALRLALQYDYETGYARRTNRQGWDVVMRRWVQPAAPFSPPTDEES